MLKSVWCHEMKVLSCSVVRLGYTDTSFRKRLGL